MRLGDYEVIGELGRGGMGVVHRARGPDGKVVAVKCLHSARKDAQGRFEREERLLAALGEEAGFVPILDAGESPRGPWFVMPFVGGGTLRDRIQKGRLGIDETVALGRALATAAGRAHALGIVHRDLKPENVLFTAAGRPLIADLGLAKHFDRAVTGGSQSISLSVSGEAKGTAGYMAPEALDDSRSVGPAADVFALGAILYECLVGEPAFQGDTVAELLARVAAGTFTPLRAARSDVPLWLDAVITRALQPVAAQRFADGATLARALGDQAPPTPARRFPARLVAAALVIAGAVVFGVRRHESGRTPPGVAAIATREGPAPHATAMKLHATWTAPADVEKRVFTALALFPDDSKAVTADDVGNRVLVWDTATGAVHATLEKLPRTAAHGVAVLFQSRRPISAHEGPAVCLWDEQIATVAHTYGMGPITPTNALAAVPGSDRFVAGGADGVLRLLDAAEPREIDWTAAHEPGGLRAVSVSPDGRRVLSGGGGGDVKLWDIASGRLSFVALVGSLTTPIAAVALDRGSRHAFAGGEDGSVASWDTARAGPVALGKHDGSVTALALVPGDESLLLSASRDGSVRLWDVARGREADRVDLVPETPLALAVYSDGGSFLVATSGGRIERRAVPHPRR